METVTIPCPVDGCSGEVTAVAEPVAGGTEWRIQRDGDEPSAHCSNDCTPPSELEGRVKAALQAG
jgi:hypothetical protein